MDGHPNKVIGIRASWVLKWQFHKVSSIGRRSQKGEPFRLRGGKSNSWPRATTATATTTTTQSACIVCSLCELNQIRGWESEKLFCGVKLLTKYCRYLAQIIRYGCLTIIWPLCRSAARKPLKSADYFSPQMDRAGRRAGASLASMRAQTLHSSL